MCTGHMFMRKRRRSKWYQLLSPPLLEVTASKSKDLMPPGAYSIPAPPLLAAEDFSVRAKANVRPDRHFIFLVLTVATALGFCVRICKVLCGLRDYGLLLPQSKIEKRNLILKKIENGFLSLILLGRVILYLVEYSGPFLMECVWV